MSNLTNYTETEYIVWINQLRLTILQNKRLDAAILKTYWTIWKFHNNMIFETDKEKEDHNILFSDTLEFLGL